MNADLFWENCKRLLRGIAMAAVVASPLRAQTFIELGAGWSSISAAPVGQVYDGGFNLRASIGRPVTSRVSVRLDLFINSFTDKTQLFPPCPYPGCTQNYYAESSGGEGGLTANALVNVDPRGIFYLTGGTGLYDLYFGPARLRWGVSAGAGVAVPVGKSVRIFAEARDHVLLGGDHGPSKLIPVTVGVRWQHDSRSGR